MDPEALAKELIRAWRGRRSQRGFSLRLGYASNVVNAWESGRRWPTAATALGVARSCGIDLQAAARTFHGVEPQWLGEVDLATPAGVTRWLGELRGKAPVKLLAERSGASRFAVSRALRGAAEPSLPEFLALVEAASGRVVDLAAALADPDRLPTVLRARELAKARMTLAAQDPWTPVVLAALCLHSYGALPAHDDQWVADQLGVDRATVERCLDTLRATGQVRWDGARWEATPIFAQDPGGDPEGKRRLKEHFARVALERLPGGPGDLFSVNFLTASEADLEQLRELHVAYFRAVREVVARSEGPLDRVVVVNTHLFTLQRSR